MSRWRTLWRAVLATLLLAALGGAATLAVAPGLLAPVETALVPVYDAVESFESDQLLLYGVGLLGVTGGLVAAIRAESGGEPTPRLVGADERPPEATSVDPATVSGYLVDRSISNVGSLADARALRDGLREAAVDALCTAGERREDARRRIERGEWTDDDIAAGFLGDAAAVPLSARLRGWLDGGAEGRRRLRRSVDAVVELTEAPGQRVRSPTEGEDE